MAEIRSLAFGPGGSAEIAGRFNQLHERSLAIFMTVGFAAIALLVLHVRADVLQRSPERSEAPAAGPENPRKAAKIP